jgi:Protein of unknown function (DUF3309)
MSNPVVIILAVILICALFGGAVGPWGYGYGYGHYSMGGLGTVLVVLLILALLGYL